MEQEILNLKQELEKLKKEKQKVEDLLIKFDEEVNRQFHLIESIKKYCMKTHMTIDEYEKLIELTGDENGQ